MSGGTVSRRERFHEVTILLVEDNADDVELLMRAMKRNGFSNKVITLNDGAQALDYLHHRGEYAYEQDDPSSTHQDPLIVLLDLKLPRVDGLEVLAQIKSNPQLRSMPVIMLTSSRQGRDIDRAYQLGVNSYVCKPTDFAEFLQVVNNLGQYWLHTVELPTLSQC